MEPQTNYDPIKSSLFVELDELRTQVREHKGLDPVRRMRFHDRLNNLDATIRANGTPFAVSVAHQGMDTMWLLLTHDDAHKALCPVEQASIVVDGKKVYPWDQKRNDSISSFDWHGFKNFSFRGPAAAVFAVAASFFLMLGTFVWYQARTSRNSLQTLEKRLEALQPTDKLEVPE